jgi:hypothetical protein
VTKEKERINLPTQIDEINHYLAMGDLKFSLKIAWLLWMGLFD